MSEKNFNISEIRHIEPLRIMDAKTGNPLDDFFLVLAVIFNDLKGIIFFEKVISDSYRKPPNDEVSGHAGEYAGLLVQISKIRTANVQEFFRFLEENKGILETPGFKDILSRTSKDIQNRWSDIVGVALNKTPENSELARHLIKVRNNVAFHYYQSGKNLRKSFLDFFLKNKHPRSKLAYHSIGETMEETRFFYADAAVGEYLGITLDGDSGEFDIKHSIKLSKIISDMNFAISRLLKEYLRSRPK